jgi:hypothetical protein
MPCMSSATGRTRTYMARTSASGHRPTWRPADSGSLRTAEDHALLAAATEAGCSVLQASDITVETSARRRARAPLGFSHLLRTLA